MPIPLITQGIRDGISSIPYALPVLRVAPWVLLLVALKYYFGGARNGSERVMHSKVVMVTGGTSGIGASVVYELASRGAQVIILTQHAPSDIFLVDYIEDLRRSTGNHLIFAEQVDLSSLHSIRTFATKWIDNVPPRRLDMIILCANTASPSSSSRLSTSSPRRVTQDGLDEEWQINYLSNFHLLSILSPALRAQPAHRDVRVIFTTCASYMGARLDLKQADTAPVPATHNLPTQPKPKGKSKPTPSKQPLPPKNDKPSSLFGVSKLSLMIFAHTFQKHLNAFKRPDGQPPCTRVLVVDPGFSRTPGMRRWLTGGSLWGLLFYLLTWPVWWLILKSPQQGAQSILYAAMEARYGRGDGGWMIKECREVGFARPEITDEAVAKRLWEFSEKQIETVETETAIKRALASKEKQAQAQAEAQAKTATTSAGSKDATPGSRRSRKGQGQNQASNSASASTSSARK